MPRKKGKHRKPASKAIPFAKGVLRDKADRLWSLAVRGDWNWKCAACHRSETDVVLNAHHLIPRQHETLRYYLRNGICLCADCHQFSPDLSPHQNAAGWLLWLSVYHPELHKWYTCTVINSEHKTFDGTTNATYFLGVIRDMKQYVSDANYERVLKTKFSKWLTDNT